VAAGQGFCPSRANLSRFQPTVQKPHPRNQRRSGKRAYSQATQSDRDLVLHEHIAKGLGIRFCLPRLLLEFLHIKSQLCSRACAATWKVRCFPATRAALPTWCIPAFRSVAPAAFRRKKHARSGSGMGKLVRYCEFYPHIPVVRAGPTFVSLANRLERHYNEIEGG
jgi:hypothetical protein